MQCEHLRLKISIHSTSSSFVPVHIHCSVANHLKILLTVLINPPFVNNIPISRSFRVIEIYPLPPCSPPFCSNSYCHTIQFKSWIRIILALDPEGETRSLFVPFKLWTARLYNCELNCSFLMSHSLHTHESRTLWFCEGYDTFPSKPIHCVVAKVLVSILVGCHCHWTYFCFAEISFGFFWLL